MSLNEAPLGIGDLLSLGGELQIRDTRQSPWRSRYCHIAGQDFTIYFDSAMTQIVLSFTISPDIIVQSDDSLFFEVFRGEEFLFGASALRETDARRWTEVIRALSIPRPHLSMADFTILAVLGRGYLGRVLLVQRNDTEERYAIKSVHKNKLYDGQCTHGILAERNILLFIKNPFFVNLLFAFQSPTKFYLGMEYVAGGELFYRMGGIGQIPLNDARLYTAEITLAIGHLHRFGIIYRDLKAENVMLDGDGHIKLTDFGLAKEIPGQASTFCGTHHYLAPEIVSHNKYSYAIDWWALGVLLCEMLTGLPPFRADNLAELFEKIINEEPSIPSEVHPTAASLITELLNKDPENRLGLEGIIEHELFDGMDWEIIAQRGYEPEWKPTLDSLGICRANFDEAVADEPLLDSDVMSGEGPNIEGFSFVSPFGAGPEEPEVILSSELIAEFEGLAKELDDD
jgi:serine/threonine protein kinase